MCGITGFWDANAASSRETLDDRVRAMAATLLHRGPDDEGAWVDPEAGIALANRRLSILDLSAAGHQPMVSPSGRYVITYNGETYNYGELQAELPLRAYRGRSDTEVILAAFDHWGIEETLRRMGAMFAFVVWDRKERQLILARDRMGEKPLYYGWSGDTFLFGSELKALRAHPAFAFEIDRDALTLYLRHDCIPAPYSIYRGVVKLLPAHFLCVSAGKRLSAPRPYWSLRASFEQPAFTAPAPELIEQLDALLGSAAQRQMLSDVPLGAFLSGGIDSSTVLAQMQRQSRRPVRTFTIGFHEDAYDEAGDARRVAQHLGTEHTELYVAAQDALATVPKLPAIYDEPFADASQIPTYLVSQLARGTVTVALSGDGGDELFGGYNRHFWLQRIWRRFGWMPQGLRRGLAATISALSPTRWDRIFRGLGSTLPESVQQRIPGPKLHKLAGILDARDAREMYYRLTSQWTEPAKVVLGANEPQTQLTAPDGARFPDLRRQMMYLDALTYLPDDLLVKADRAGMAVGLENRVPLLDHRVVEFAARVPMQMKIRDGKGKWLLRQVLNKYVPAELVDRPKAGFAIPLAEWLRGPLREWAESFLNEPRLRREGFFDPAPVRDLWKEHLSGKRDWEYHLWNVLMFQAWLEQNPPRLAPPSAAARALAL